MITLIYEEKAVGTIHHFKIKMLNKLGIEGTYFSIIKAKYDKPTISIILSSESHVTHDQKMSGKLFHFKGH